MPTLKSSRVVIGDETRPATIRFEGGVVVGIGSGTADDDFGDLVVLPGLVDSHVHINEPGRTDWEGFVTATRAAIAGGTTTVVDMPLNSIPPTVEVSALAEKRDATQGKLSCDVAFWGGIVPGSEGEIDALTNEGVCGFKVFLTDSGVPEYPPLPMTDLSAVETELPLLIHAEDPRHLSGLEGPADYSRYLKSRPPIAEASAIDQVAALGKRAHILHVSSGDAVDAVARAPRMSAETCPHYLVFDAEDVPVGATEFKCAPPIRERHHREALWHALSSGELSMIVSDHSPSPPELKSRETGDFAAAWGGIAGLQLRLQATWTEAAARGIGLATLSTWLSGAPAHLAGLEGRKGSISVGGDADFAVFDPDAPSLVRGANLEHRHGLTPYEGMSLRGGVVRTILAGVTVFDGGIVATGRGRMLRR